MSEATSTRARISAATAAGLFIGLFGMLLLRQVVSYSWPQATFISAVTKETGMWLVAVVLIVIVRRGERLPLTSIGFTLARWRKSILWGLALATICFIVAGALIALTHYHGGEGGKAMDKLPIWLISLIVLRAGVVEELCYRGYPIERLAAIGLPRWLAAAIPLIIFSLSHWTGGWGNIVIALALGAILAAFYLWRRDLVANMIGHFLVDFIANVVPKILG
jgi:membrane protease YdiL (CAAX protease family)